MRINAFEAAKASGGTLISGDGNTVLSSIATDSNAIGTECIFVPVIGARVDGHRFIAKAFENGAKAAFTSEELPEEVFAAAGGRPLIRVDDTVKALQRMGSYYRDNYVHIPYIGVTGSVGKTTTREMIVCALNASFETYGTKGNANSQIGVPITVCQTTETAKAGVIEMGISEPGEMTKISEVVKCDAAVVTMIGVSHISNLGSRENIMKEKLHIADFMKENGCLLLNGNDELLRHVTHESLKAMGLSLRKDIRIYFYGTEENAYFRALNIEHDGTAPSEYDFYTGNALAAHVRLSVPGDHMLMDSLAAMASAVVLGADPEMAAGALFTFKSLEGRGAETVRDGIRIINDAYNASPQSMEAGLKAFGALKPEPSGRRIAVIADMLELGNLAESLHSDIGRSIIREIRGIDEVLMLGGLSRHIYAAMIDEAEAVNGKVNAAASGDTALLELPESSKIRAVMFKDAESLLKYLKAEVRKGDAVFFKGSNSMGLWKLAKEMTGEESD